MVFCNWDPSSNQSLMGKWSLCSRQKYFLKWHLDWKEELLTSTIDKDIKSTEFFSYSCLKIKELQVDGQIALDNESLRREIFSYVV